MRLETMYLEDCVDVATVILNRPHVLNCVNGQWVRDFHTILDVLLANSRLRLVIVRGAGRAFCSGIDLTALSEGHLGPEFFNSWETALRRLETMDALVVAAIHSHCVGGGLQLALACDLRLAREDARLGVTAVKEGIIPGIGMWRIARHAGLGRAKRLALAGDIVDVQTALQYGLVDYVAEAASYEARLRELTGRLLEMTWTSTRLTKKLINTAFDSSWAECVEVFREYQRFATESPEHREAMAVRRSARVQRRSASGQT